MDDELEKLQDSLVKKMGQRKLPRNTYGNIGRRTGKLITNVGKIHEISQLFVSSDSELSESDEPTNEVISQKSLSERRRPDPPPTFLTDSESDSEELDCSRNRSPAEGDNTSTDNLQQKTWKKIHSKSETSTEVNGKSEQECISSQSETDDNKKGKENSNDGIHNNLDNSMDRGDTSDFNSPIRVSSKKKSIVSNRAGGSTRMNFSTGSPNIMSDYLEMIKSQESSKLNSDLKKRQNLTKSDISTDDTPKKTGGILKRRLTFSEKTQSKPVDKQMKKKTRDQSLESDSDEEYIIEPLDKSSFIHGTKSQETAKTTGTPRGNKRQEIEKLLSPATSRSEPDIVEDEINKISPIRRRSSSKNKPNVLMVNPWSIERRKAVTEQDNSNKKKSENLNEKAFKPRRGLDFLDSKKENVENASTAGSRGKDLTKSENKELEMKKKKSKSVSPIKSAEVEDEGDQVKRQPRSPLLARVRNTRRSRTVDKKKVPKSISKTNGKKTNEVPVAKSSAKMKKVSTSSTRQGNKKSSMKSKNDQSIPLKSPDSSGREDEGKAERDTPKKMTNKESNMKTSGLDSWLRSAHDHDSSRTPLKVNIREIPARFLRSGAIEKRTKIKRFVRSSANDMASSNTTATSLPFENKTPKRNLAFPTSQFGPSSSTPRRRYEEDDVIVVPDVSDLDSSSEQEEEENRRKEKENRRKKSVKKVKKTKLSKDVQVEQQEMPSFLAGVNNAIDLGSSSENSYSVKPKRQSRKTIELKRKKTKEKKLTKDPLSLSSEGINLQTDPIDLDSSSENSYSVKPKRPTRKKQRHLKNKTRQKKLSEQQEIPKTASSAEADPQKGTESHAPDLNSLPGHSYSAKSEGQTRNKRRSTRDKTKVSKPQKEAQIANGTASSAEVNIQKSVEKKKAVKRKSSSALEDVPDQEPARESPKIAKRSKKQSTKKERKVKKVKTKAKQSHDTDDNHVSHFTPPQFDQHVAATHQGFPNVDESSIHGSRSYGEILAAMIASASSPQKNHKEGEGISLADESDVSSHASQDTYSVRPRKLTKRQKTTGKKGKQTYQKSKADKSTKAESTKSLINDSHKATKQKSNETGTSTLLPANVGENSRVEPDKKSGRKITRFVYNFGIPTKKLVTPKICPEEEALGLRRSRRVRYAFHPNGFDETIRYNPARHKVEDTSRLNKSKKAKNILGKQRKPRDSEEKNITDNGARFDEMDDGGEHSQMVSHVNGLQSTVYSDTTPINGENTMLVLKENSVVAVEKSSIFCHGKDDVYIGPSGAIAKPEDAIHVTKGVINNFVQQGMISLGPLEVKNRRTARNTTCIFVHSGRVIVKLHNFKDVFEESSYFTVPESNHYTIINPDETKRALLNYVIIKIQQHPQ